MYSEVALTVKAPTKELAHHCVMLISGWLSNSGEQDLWLALEMGDDELPDGQWLKGEYVRDADGIPVGGYTFTVEQAEE